MRQPQRSNDLVVVSLALVRRSYISFDVTAYAGPVEAVSEAGESAKETRVACYERRVKLMENFAPPVRVLGNENPAFVEEAILLKAKALLCWFSCLKCRNDGIGFRVCLASLINGRDTIYD